MSIRNLYISPQNYDWRQSGLSINSFIFLTKKNIDFIINDSKIHDCYSSLEDLGFEKLNTICIKSSTIELIGFDEDYIDSLNHNFIFFNFVRTLLRHSKHRSKITYDWLDRIITKINALQNYRTTDEQVLWTVGCSLTSSDYVKPTERWGHLLSKRLNLPEIQLGLGGSSIFWQTDQILRSNIKKDDIVVWGLTNTFRVNYAEKYELKNCTIGTYNEIDQDKHYWTLDYFDSSSLAISNIKQIKQVINCCEKLGVKLYLVNLAEVTWFPLVFYKQKNFLDLTPDYDTENNQYLILDRGTDGSHPGPLQNQYYADKIYEFITANLNETGSA